MKRQLLVKAPIQGVSGYATYIRELLTAFIAKYGSEYLIGAERYPWQEYDASATDPAEEEMIQKLLSTKVQKDKSILLNWTLPHEYGPDCRINIGYTLFETDRITDKWRSYCNRMDMMWLPSTFNRQTFWDSGVTVPIDIVPGGVHPFFFQDAAPLDLPEITTGYNFFMGGQWIPGENDRKNMTKVIRTFCETFRDRSDVGLVLKVYTYTNNTMDYDLTQKRILAIKEALGIGEYPKIYLVHGVLDRIDLLRLMKRVDCAVQPSPEGWGMWHIQCAAAGLPVIAYNWSSYTDFLHQDYTPYIQHGEMEIVSDDMKHLEPYHGTHFWPRLDTQQLAQKMHELVKNPVEWKQKAVLQSQYLQKNWTWEHAADKMFNQLEKVWSGGEKPKQIIPINTYIAPPEQPNIGTIVVCHGNQPAVENFLTPYLRNTSKSVAHTVIVVNGNIDNNKTVLYLQNMAKTNPITIMVENETISFAQAANKAVKWLLQHYTVPYVLFIDTNILIKEYTTLPALTCILDKYPDVACVGPKIVAANNTIFAAGMRIPTNSLQALNLGNGEVDDGQYDDVVYTDFVSGACMIVRVKDLPAFNPAFFVAYKNLAMQFRLRETGKKIVLNGQASVCFDKEFMNTAAAFDVLEKHREDHKIFLAYCGKRILEENEKIYETLGF